MELILIGVNIILQIDFDVFVHLGVDVLAQEATDNRDTLLHISLKPLE